MSAWLRLRCLVGAGARAGGRQSGCRGLTAGGSKWLGATSVPSYRSSAVLQVGGITFRSLCTAPSRTITYEELKEVLRSQSSVIIDVREPWEIHEYGKIPGSINIPVGEVGTALQMAAQDFKEKYNRNIPAKSDSLVFSCLAGVRSLKALDVALSLGYSRSQHYLGGFDDFVRHESPVKEQ